MKKSTKNFLSGAGLAAVGVATIGFVCHYTTKYMMKLALDREEPKRINKSKKKLISSAELSEIYEKVISASEKLENSGLEQVKIESPDGLCLVGHWFCPENPKRAIVAMHGWRSTWSRDFGVISPFLHENDCAVLYVEQRGQGNSEGEYMGFGLLERYDCLNWINWILERTNNKLPVYLCGISMGATTVLMTSGFDLPKNVHGIIADCGFTSPKAIWKHVAQSSLHIPYEIYRTGAENLCKQKLQVGSDSYTCKDALQNCKVPVLFIHGTDDRFVPVEMTYENFKNCASKKKLFVVPGAEHGMSYVVDKEGYEKTVKDFWAENDFQNN